MRKRIKERWIEHYSSTHKILLVGEGDFSFSACLARTFRSATNMVATCLHSQDEQVIKHWSSEDQLNELYRLGCLVLHEVDVHSMHHHPTLMEMKFDIIIFNFPHAGHFSWLYESHPKLIKKHKALLKGYFTSAKQMLSDRGEIHVTHRDDYPYCEWKLEEIATKLGLKLTEKVEFSKKDYPGYHNKRGSDIGCNKTFPLKDCYTFKFQKIDTHSKLGQDLSLAFDELHIK